MPPTTRRILRRLALATALGAVTTVVIAVICAWQATVFAQGTFSTRSGQRLTDPAGVKVHESGGIAPPDTQYLEFNVYERFGATFGHSRLRPFNNYTPAAPPPTNPTPESVASHWERAELLPWLDGRRAWPDPKKGDGVWLKASGWPFRSFVCTLFRTNAPNFATHTWSVKGGLILSNPTFPGWADWPPMFPRIIPLRPMWPELFLNLALFTGAWALVLFPFAAFRQARRQRRGLCPACAYDLRGLDPETACPECGSNPRNAP